MLTRIERRRSLESPGLPPSTVSNHSLATPQIGGVIFPDALFEAPSHLGMGLGSAPKVRESKFAGLIEIACLIHRREKVRGLAPAVRRGRVETMKAHASGEQKLLNGEVVIGFVRKVRPRCGILRPQD